MFSLASFILLFCLLLACVGRQTCVYLLFCRRPGLFMSHKLRGSVLALPASHYLRDFLSPTLSSVSILLGCTFLSQGMESGMSLSGVQQKERRRRNLGSKMLWRVILALDQGSMKLGFSALTWQHSWVCLGHSPTTLSRGMISSVWALQRSASGLLWGRCGENPNS